MANIKGNSLDYFQLYCESDRKLNLIEAKHGTQGWGIVIKILSEIFKIDGYYTVWNEDTMYLFLRNRGGVSIELLKEIVKTCFEKEIFSQEMFDKYQILTSEEIQEKWHNIILLSKRKGAMMNPLYALIESTFIKNQNSGILPPKFSDFDPIVKYSKVNNSKINKTSKESECANAHTHTREERIPVFENSVFSEKKVNEPAEAQKQMLVAEKKGKEKNCAQKEKIEKVQVRERVHLKPAEIEQLKRELGEEGYNFVVDKVDLYKGAKGKKYQDDFCAIKSWGFAALTEHKAKTANLDAQKEKKKGAKACIAAIDRMDRKYSNSAYA